MKTEYQQILSLLDLKLAQLHFSDMGNDELMKFYVDKIIGNSASPEEIEAINKEMKNRRITPGNMIIGFNFTVDGKEETISISI